MHNRAEIVGLNKHNFHDIVTFVQNILSHPYGGRYKRAEAQQFVIDGQDSTFVLELDGEVIGAYAFHDMANAYGLNFFALKEKFRATKSGYLLYKHMKQTLKNKPVNVVIYDDNDAMMNVVKKRGTLVGKVPSVGGKVVAYYSIFFNDFNKKDKK